MIDDEAQPVGDDDSDNEEHSDCDDDGKSRRRGAETLPTCARATHRGGEDRPQTLGLLPPSRDPRLEKLLERQRLHCPRALSELSNFPRKTTHWIWWVFPTEKEGAHEPRPPTVVTRETAAELLARAPPAWRFVLGEIGELVESYGIKVLPQEDHARVKCFVAFWRAANMFVALPEWKRAAATTRRGSVLIR